MRFIIRLKRIPRLFVVWHGESSVVIILSELIIPFFNGFSSRNTCNAHGFMLYCMQMRRYGQIDLSPRCHYLQVLVGATRWRFKSSCPHHQKALKTMNFQGFLVFSFCSYTAVGGRHVYDVNSTNRNLSLTTTSMNQRIFLQTIHPSICLQNSNPYFLYIDKGP